MYIFIKCVLSIWTLIVKTLILTVVILYALYVYQYDEEKQIWIKIGENAKEIY